MLICEIYARLDGTISNVITGDFGSPDANTTLVVQFDVDNYPTEHEAVNNQSDKLFWDGANLQLDSVIYLDATWIAARKAEIDNAVNVEIEDTTEKRELLNQYNAALTQIANDLTDVATGKAALPNATLAQTRQIVDGMLTILQHQLNREERTLNALRAILRSGLT